MNLYEIRKNKFRDLSDNEFIVYRLLNKVNSKSYIGATKNLKNRIREHVKDAKGEYSIFCSIHDAILKHGLLNFDLEILEVINDRNEDLLYSKETEYILKYKTTESEFGYNITSGGPRPRVLNKETLAKISESSNNIKVKVASYNLNGEFIKEYNSIMDASRDTGIQSNDIVRLYKKEGTRRIGFMFRRVNEDGTYPDKIEPYKFKGNQSKYKNMQEIPNTTSHNSKKCKITNLLNNEVIEANSFREASTLLGLSPSYIGLIYRKKKFTNFKIEVL